MDKLKMGTTNCANQNYYKLAEMFPNAITETVDSNGHIIRAIDADILEQEINSHVVKGSEERYQFTWPGKRQAMLIGNMPTSSTLRPCIGESVGRDGMQGGFDSENLYIEGDNLEVLKLLQETYLGKVKMIYIDPPYNTGNNFVYRDNFTQETREYISESGQHDINGGQLVQNLESNGRFHSDWLNMLYPRLKLAKNLLSNDGVIFISIDDNEAGNCIKVCNEIFGEQNYITQFPWQSRQSIQNDTDISINHEYIIAYAKIRRQENRRLKESNANAWFNHDSFVFLPLPLDKSKFDNPDNDPRGLWKADPMDAPNIRPNLTYPIVNPITGEKHLPPNGRHWRILPEKLSGAISDGRVIFGKNGIGRPQLKVFYEEKKMFGSIDNSWWTGDRFGTATQGTKEMIEIFGSGLFDTPKPVKLLYNLLKLVSSPTDDDIILDFFSGSATTAHAVMQLNAEDGGNRKFIMVQLPEETPEKSEARKAGYKNICEIGKERIRRAGAKIKAETGADIDYGFRVLKCDSSNMKPVYYAPADTEQEQLDILADNIKQGRTGEDLLFQVMLELGVPLSSTIESIEVSGQKIFDVGQNYLLACFDLNVTEASITEIAKRQPAYFVMRDRSMANDTVAANFEQIFRTYSPDTVRKVL